MKFLASIVAILAITAFATTANAQCFSRNVVAVQGFNTCVGGQCFVQQQVLVPQSTAFFTGGRSVAFVNQPAFVNVGVPVVNVAAVNRQRVVVRRGLFGRQVVRVNNRPAAVRVVTPGVNVAVGRRNVFVSGF